ncbi:hypothetical protein KI387_006982, partial [Taxus chinensis]
MFDNHEQFLKRNKEYEDISSSEVPPLNLGVEDEPKLVGFGKCCSDAEKESFMMLLEKYID